MAKAKQTKQIQRFATVTLANGMKKRIAARGKTEREAIRNLEKLKAEYEAGLIVVNSNTTFDKWFEEYMRVYKAPAITESSQKDILNVINLYFMPDLKYRRLNEIKLIHLQSCINEMSGKSYSYIQKGYTYIKDIFQKAVENDLLIKSPASGLIKPKAVKGTRRSLTDSEKAMFIKALPEHKHGALFGIMLACGLRPAEARALSIFDIDLKNQMVTIRHALENHTTNLKPPKTSAGNRTIPIPDWYYPILEKHLAQKRGSVVFANANGEYMSETATKRAWKSLIHKINIDNGATLYKNVVIIPVYNQEITPYYLRHTYATSLAENGVDIKTAQYLLGHANISMTAQIYTHVTAKMIDSAKEKIKVML